jgi:hypothetical protein
VNNIGILSGQCPASNNTSPDACGLVDFIGWGGTIANVGCAENSNPGPTTANDTALRRINECNDTNDNAADFETIAQADASGNPLNPPHNSTSSKAPSISRHPANATSCATLTATFSVVADGACLSYQWQVKPPAGSFANVTTGTGGNTSTYTTAALAAGDNGNQYRVVVSNAYGPTVTSNAGTLTLGLTATDQQLKIATIYTGGGVTAATWQNDFVELYNTGPSPVSLDGWSIQYASATGVNWNPVALSGSIASGY